MIQTVSKNTFGESPMLLDFEGFLLAQPFADDVRPTKRQRQQGDQLLQTFRLDHVGFFKPEAATLQTTEQRLDFPSLRIVFYRTGGVSRRHHNQIFAAGQTHSRNRQLQPPDAAALLDDQRFSDCLPAKQSPRRHQLSPPVGDLRVLANANAKRDMVINQTLEPDFANKL